MIQRVMTAEEFSLHRSELPDAGQWAELIRGVPVTLQPPDLDHGTVVLNLSKAFSAYVHASLNGYPVFDLGLLIEKRPDTVFFPAVSYFRTSPRFAEADHEITQTVPNLVVELLSTNDRRRQVNERVSAYLKHGVKVLWLIDPVQRLLHVTGAAIPAARRLTEFEQLRGEPELPGFQIQVGELFQEPDWAH